MRNLSNLTTHPDISDARYLQYAFHLLVEPALNITDGVPKWFAGWKVSIQTVVAAGKLVEVVTRIDLQYVASRRHRAARCFAKRTLSFRFPARKPAIVTHSLDVHTTPL